MARNTSFKATVFAIALIAMLAGDGTVHAQDRPSEKQMPFVAVTTITNNAEIQAIIDGMRDELAKRGRWPGDTITIEIADAEADTARMNRELQAVIDTMPEQYYWVHKRFKTRPEGEPSVYSR